MKRIALIGAFFIVLAASLIWFFALREKPVKFDTSIIQREGIAAQVTASGKIAAEDEADLAFKISGQVNSVSVRVGDNVEKGQVIAQLDKRQLEINLSQKEASLRSTQSDLEKVLDDIRLAQYGNQTTGETQTQKNLREKAEAAQSSAFEAVQAAMEQLKDAILTSPIAGRVAILEMTVGETVTANSKVAKVADFSKLILTAEVDETDIAKVAVGQKVKVTLDAYEGKEFDGEVLRVHPQTTVTSTGANIVKTEIRLLNFYLPVQLGLSGDAEIIIEQKEKVLTIPTQALVTEADKTFVFVVENGLLRKREIKLGLTVEEKAEVQDGLVEGEKIVTSNLDKVKEGVKI